MKRKVSTFPSTGKASANSVERGQQKWASTFEVRPRHPLKSQPGAGTATSSPPISAPRLGQPACGRAVHLAPRPEIGWSRRAAHVPLGPPQRLPTRKLHGLHTTTSLSIARHTTVAGDLVFGSGIHGGKLWCSLPRKCAVHQGSYGAIAFMAVASRQKRPRVRVRLTMEP